MQYARVVLKPQATWANVQSTGFKNPKWKAAGFSRCLLDEPYIKRWKSVDGNCVITYMQDPLREVRCYHLTGADLDIHTAIIRGRMPTFDHSEIEAMMVSARTLGEKIAAVYHSAASAPLGTDL